MGYFQDRIENLRRRFLPKGESDASRPSTGSNDRRDDDLLRSVNERPAPPHVQVPVGVPPRSVDPGVADALDWWARARLHQEQLNDTQIVDGPVTVVNEHGIPIRKYSQRPRYNDIRRRYKE